MTEQLDERHLQTLEAVQADPDVSRLDGALQAHLQACEECQATLEASQALRARLQRHLGGEAPSELVQQLRSKVGALANDPTPVGGPGSSRRAPVRPTRRIRSRIGNWWWTAVPTALAAGLAIGMMLPRDGHLGSLPNIRDDEVVKSVADYLQDVTHDRYLLEGTGRPYEVAGDEPTRASDWLSEGLGFAVDLPEAPEGWTLAGVRVWHTVSRLSALAGYRGPDGTEIMVFAVPAAELEPSGLEPVRTPAGPVWVEHAWSQTGVAWFDGDLAWSAVAPVSRDELLKWSTAYRQAARP